MKNNLFFDFHVNKATNTITVQRVFAAKRALVWDAWTKAEILDQWWAADGWESHTKKLDFTEGGYRHYQMKGPENEVLWGLTRYAMIQLQQTFSGTECFADEHAVVDTALPQSTYKITFKDQDDETFIEHITTYASLEDLESSLQYGFEKGTLDAYGRLDAFLGKPRF